MARKAISNSVRWQIFARDGFRCRYCGRQAGDNGVVLQVEHLVSVKDGGTNAMDNLLSACQACNNGKHSRSLESFPTSAEAVANSREQTANLQNQAAALMDHVRAKAELRNALISVICDAYGVKEFQMTETNLKQLARVLDRHGPATTSEWIHAAAYRKVKTTQLCRYVHGIIRANRNSHQEHDEV